MAQNSTKQVELVLENRQVMGIFLVVAVLCGIFFALGFVIGRNTMSAGDSSAEVAEANIPAGEKPSALPSPTYIPRSAQAAVAAEPAGEAAADTDLSFYNNVETKAPDGSAESDAEPKQSAAADPVGPPPAGIIVQVSALTRREDAESLLTLLKERKLPVLVTTGANDKLYHVVIGPYKTDKEAEDVRQMLEKDGFRPFVRR